MDGAKKPKSYNGTEAYIFISYAHADQDIVWKVILQMDKDLYRVWYDDGIDPGTEWDDSIAIHIERCRIFIAFMSEKYLKSENCKDELNYARDLGKNRLLIYIEDVRLTGGLAMRLNRIQSIWYCNYLDFNKFLEKLYQTKEIELCMSSRKEIGCLGRGDFVPYIQNRTNLAKCIEKLEHNLYGWGQLLCGIKADKTIQCFCKNNPFKETLLTWKNIKKLIVDSDHIVGLCDDGTAMFCGNVGEEYRNFFVGNNFVDILPIAPIAGYVGLTNYNSVVCILSKFAYSEYSITDIEAYELVGQLQNVDKIYYAAERIFLYHDMIENINKVIGFPCTLDVSYFDRYEYSAKDFGNEWKKGRFLDICANPLWMWGLKDTGKVVHVGSDKFGNAEKIKSWSDIMKITTTPLGIVGLSKEGRVLIQNYNKIICNGNLIVSIARRKNKLYILDCEGVLHAIDYTTKEEYILREEVVYISENGYLICMDGTIECMPDEEEFQYEKIIFNEYIITD